MEVFGPFLDGYANVHIQLWELLRERTFAALDEHTRRKAAMTRPEEVYERAKIIRETFLASIGGLPERDCPPDAASYRPAADLHHMHFPHNRSVPQSPSYRTYMTLT